jgi:lipoate-protein ligase A
MGNSNYCVMMPRDMFTRRANVEMMARALHHLDIPAQVNGRHDLVVDQKKISFQ